MICASNACEAEIRVGGRVVSGAEVAGTTEGVWATTGAAGTWSGLTVGHVCCCCCGTVVAFVRSGAGVTCFIWTGVT